MAPRRPWRVAQSAGATGLVCAFCAALAAGCVSSRTARPAQTAAATDGAHRARAAAVEINAGGCRTVDVRGAGSLVDGGIILTAAHVVSGAETITVRAASDHTESGVDPVTGPPVVVRLLAIDPVNDLAALGADTTTMAGLDRRPLALGTATAGATGTAVVYRDEAAKELPFTITEPVVVRILDIHHEHTVSRPGYRVAVTIAAGDSGAVMVTADGTAVGVLYAKTRATDDRAFASDTSAVGNLVAAAAAVDPAIGIDTGECV